MKVHPSLASLGTWKKFTESTKIFSNCSNCLKLTFFLFSCVILFVFEVDSALPLDTHYKSSQIGGKRLLLSIAMTAINILNKIATFWQKILQSTINSVTLFFFLVKPTFLPYDKVWQHFYILIKIDTFSPESSGEAVTLAESKVNTLATLTETREDREDHRAPEHRESNSTNSTYPPFCWQEFGDGRGWRPSRWGRRRGPKVRSLSNHSIFPLVRLLHFYGPPVPSIGASMSPSQGDNKTNEYGF